MNDPTTQGSMTADLAKLNEIPAHAQQDEAGEDTVLFPEDAREEFRRRWNEVQGGFVDAPHESVQQADALVAEVSQELAKTFADQRAQLEDAWGRGGEASTEDLRVTLKRYRAFFDRLLSL